MAIYLQIEHNQVCIWRVIIYIFRRNYLLKLKKTNLFLMKLLLFLLPLKKLKK